MPDCEHTKTEFLMRRDGIDYMRCLACDQVFEEDDLLQADSHDEDAEGVPLQHHRLQHQRVQHQHRKAS